MNGDRTFNLIMAGIIATAAVAIALILTHYDVKSTQLYIENKYEQVILPGSQGYKWQKVK